MRRDCCDGVSFLQEVMRTINNTANRFKGWQDNYLEGWTYTEKETRDLSHKCELISAEFVRRIGVYNKLIDRVRRIYQNISAGDVNPSKQEEFINKLSILIATHARNINNFESQSYDSFIRLISPYLFRFIFWGIDYSEINFLLAQSVLADELIGKVNHDLDRFESALGLNIQPNKQNHQQVDVENTGTNGSAKLVNESNQVVKLKRKICFSFNYQGWLGLEYIPLTQNSKRISRGYDDKVEAVKLALSPDVIIKFFRLLNFDTQLWFVQTIPQFTALLGRAPCLAIEAPKKPFLAAIPLNRFKARVDVHEHVGTANRKRTVVSGDSSSPSVSNSRLITKGVFIYGAVVLDPSLGRLQNQISSNRTPYKLEGDVLKQFKLGGELNVQAHDGKAYQFSCSGNITKAVLRAEAHLGEKAQLGRTIVNMMDNVVAKNGVVNVDTQDPFVAAIARRHLDELKKKGIPGEIKLRGLPYRQDSELISNDIKIINEIMDEVQKASATKDGDSWERELRKSIAKIKSMCGQNELFGNPYQKRC